MKLSKRKVLLIEDDLISCYFVKYLLESKGIQVDAVGKGQKGLSKLQYRPYQYDLIITDIELPDIHGIELIKAIRNISQTRIVAISSHMNAIREECLKAGAEKAFNKPLSPVDFTQIGLLILKPKLPEKQLQALALYNQGYDRKASAQALNVTENTIAWYLKVIRAKFSIRSRKGMLELEESLKTS